ncbi:MAG TPA: GPP34 family phosphoprotein [Streptosporangiaceae bacterium]
MLTLPEDLVILAVGAKPRGGPNNGKLSWRFPNGIRGAMLVALTLAGRVEVADERIVVRDPAPLGDQFLDEALAGLVASRGAPAGEWMRDTPPRFVSVYFDRLEAAGLLRSETVWLLFIAKRAGYRLVDTAYYENLRAAVRAAVTGTGPAEPALLALGGMVYAGGISDLVFPGRDNESLRAKLAEFAGSVRVPGGHQEPGDTDDPLRWAMDPAIDATAPATHAAVHASVQGAVSAATSASESHHHSGGASSDSSPSHHH